MSTLDWITVKGFKSIKSIEDVGTPPNQRLDWIERRRKVELHGGFFAP